MSASVPETRFERPRAIETAKRFVGLIDDACARLVVAGSLRRRLALIGDVEIVAVPKVARQTVDLLGDVVVPHDLLDARLSELLASGVVTKRLDRRGVPRWGRTLKYLLFDGMPIDLFAPESPDRFGWILLLRTGPAAFSRQLVLPKGQKTKDGRAGLLPPHVVPRDGWLTERTSGYRIPTPDEQDAFAALGLAYRAPWERS